MASLCNDPRGRRRIVVEVDGHRRPIRLGRMSRRQAESILLRVEHLANAKNSGGPVEQETAAWLTSIEPRLYARLARAGLVGAVKSMTLAQLVDSWLDRRKATLQPQTVVRLEQGKRSLLNHFGADRIIGTITEGDAEDYRAALLTEGLAEATARKRCSDARVWFRYAVRHGLLRSNAFEAVPTAATATSKLVYISESDALAVLDKITDPDLRLLFVLARWGGVRTVSEPKALTWDCVDWERGRITIKSPKTARHAGHEQRVIPMFPELVEHLQAAFDRAEAGQAHVLPILKRISSAALRKPMLAAIRRAGLTQWPRLWHNLRSSRQTDLEARFPSHVVGAWLGNSRTIAVRHYLQVLDRDFERATRAPEKAARNPARTGADLGELELIGSPSSAEKTPDLSGQIRGNLSGSERPDDPDGI